MKPNSKNLKIFVLVIAAIALASVFTWLKLKTDLNKAKSTQQLQYEQKITGEDKKELEIPPHNRTIKIPILMYHHVGEYPLNASPMRRDLTVSTADFKQQAEWLKEQGFTTIRLFDIYLYSIGQFKLPKKPLVITFDDGYDDVFINAVPILKNLGLTGSFAIITQYPHTQAGDNFYASWEEIAQAYKDGNEIVSHTQNHFDGKDKKYSLAYIQQNLTGSIKDIYDHLGFETQVLIYPYGHYTPDYIALAKKVGFVMGLTIHNGQTINLDNLMEMPRVRVHGGENLESFKHSVLK